MLLSEHLLNIIIDSQFFTRAHKDSRAAAAATAEAAAAVVAAAIAATEAAAAVVAAAEAAAAASSSLWLVGAAAFPSSLFSLCSLLGQDPKQTENGNHANPSVCVASAAADANDDAARRKVHTAAKNSQS